MPGEKTQLEHYHYYCASQRRVEEWVQETEQQLKFSQNGAAPDMLARGFLEDPCLATPVSLSAPDLDKGKGKAREEDISFSSLSSAAVNPHDLLGASFERPSVPHRHHQDDDDSEPPLPIRISTSRHQRKRSRDQQDPSQHASSSRSRPTLGLGSKKIKVDSEEAISGRSSSKHSKNSKDSKYSRQATIGTGTSKSRSSSRKHHHHRTRSSHQHRAGKSIVAYLPYGVIPLLFAMTTGSSVVSLAAAAIMLVGYLCMDYNTEDRRSKS